MSDTGEHILPTATDPLPPFLPRLPRRRRTRPSDDGALFVPPFFLALETSPLPDSDLGLI
jgi:hypothetical protein